MTQTTVQGFPVRTDLLYDFDHHMWVADLGGGRVRIGMDALGVETSGTLAHLAFAEEGASVSRGEPFGSLEAEKYVGPLVAPLSGTVVAVNHALVANPSRVHADPYGDGWMIEVATSRFAEERPTLVGGDDEVRTRLDQKITEYRLEGVLAE